MLRVFLIVACLVSFCGTNKLLLCELYIYKGVVCLFPYMQTGLLLVVSSVLLQHIPSSTAAVKSSGLWQCVEPRGGSHWSPSLSIFTEYSASRCQEHCCSPSLPWQLIFLYGTPQQQHRILILRTFYDCVGALRRPYLNWMVKGNSKSIIAVIFVYISAQRLRLEKEGLNGTEDIHNSIPKGKRERERDRTVYYSLQSSIVLRGDRCFSPFLATHLHCW